MEVFRLLRLDAVLDTGEAPPELSEAVLDGQAGVTRPVAVLLEGAELQEVVDDALAGCRSCVDQLVDLALAHVRTVDERVGVHPQEPRDTPTDVSGSVDGPLRSLECALGRLRLGAADADPPVDPVGGPIVAEPQCHGRLVGAGRHELVEGLLECSRPVESEEAGFEDGGLAAAVGAVDDGHAGIQFEVGGLVTPDVPEADALEDHRNSSIDACPSDC